MGCVSVAPTGSAPGIGSAAAVSMSMAPRWTAARMLGRVGRGASRRRGEVSRTAHAPWTARCATCSSARGSPNTQTSSDGLRWTSDAAEARELLADRPLPARGLRPRLLARPPARPVLRPHQLDGHDRDGLLLPPAHEPAGAGAGECAAVPALRPWREPVQPVPSWAWPRAYGRGRRRSTSRARCRGGASVADGVAGHAEEARAAAGRCRPSRASASRSWGAGASPPRENRRRRRGDR